MSTVAQPISSAVVAALPFMAQGFEGTRQEAAQMRGLSEDDDGSGPDDPGSQTESSIERGIRLRAPVGVEWGRSESLDPDNVGDIADEGAGHRG